MRRFVAVALVLTLSVVVATTGIVAGAGTAATGQAEPPVTVSVGGENTVSPGNTTTVAVKINSSVEIYAVQFTLVVEPRSVDIVSSSRGSYLSQNGSSLVVVNDINRSNATYGETRIKSDRGVAGTGALATVRLAVPDDSENVSLHLADVSVVDPSIESLSARVENHTLAVRGPNDNDTAQPSEPATDEETNEGSDSSTGDTISADGSTDGSGEPSGSDPTGSADSPVDTGPQEWRSKVDQRVIDKVDGTGASPILIEIQSPRSTRFDQTAAQLNESGLQNATLNRELQVVRGTAGSDSLPQLANVTGVARIRYDLSVDQQPSPTTPAGSSTVTGSPEQASGTETAVSSKTATSTGGPGFTAPLALIGAVVCLLLMGRQASV